MKKKRGILYDYTFTTQELNWIYSFHPITQLDIKCVPLQLTEDIKVDKKLAPKLISVTMFHFKRKFSNQDVKKNKFWFLMSFRHWTILVRTELKITNFSVFAYQHMVSGRTILFLSYRDKPGSHCPRDSTML